MVSPVFDLESMLCCPLDGRGWLEAARAVAVHVVYVVPRSVQVEQFGRLLGAAESMEFVEVEDIALNYKVKLKAGYYGPKFRVQRHKKNKS